jgi:exosortase A
MAHAPSAPRRSEALVHAERQIEMQLALALRPRRVALLGALALVPAVIFAWHAQTFMAMARTWWRTETYAHGLLVLPMFGYLVWRVRDRLAAAPVRPYAPALAGVALAGFIWLLGDLSATIGVQQFGMVAMVPLAVCAVLGRSVVRIIAFPLAFLFFAIPFGGFMLPWLMEMTADFTVSALRLSGVPVYREGMSFLIPSGAWSVVEACSGLRYLIASFMVGTLYAYLTYRSPRRRLLFIGLSLVVPLVANWLRAYLIVMLGHLSDNRLAAGVDHLIYGWVFFGMVMLAMYWIGAKWREDLNDVPPPRAPLSDGATVPWLPRRSAAVALLALLAVVVWKPAAQALDAQAASGPVVLQPLVPAAGWTLAERPLVEWTPSTLDTPTAALTQAFRREGDTVVLHIAYYRNQSETSEAVRGEGELTGNNDLQWKRTGVRNINVRIAGQDASALRAENIGPRDRLIAWRWYWVGGRMTANPYAAKAYLAWSALRGHGDDSAAVVLYTRKHDAADHGDTRLADFVADMSPQLLAHLRRAQAGGS